MNILDVALAGKIAASGGGGGGTDDYNDLLHLPQINGVTLSGDKTPESLGLQGELTFDTEPTEDSTNPVESGGVFTALASKQDAISDLETIRSGASAGATAVQPSALETALSAKQDSLSETQLAAVNSGINSTKVAQIETNKDNISLVQSATEKLIDEGAKNLYDISSFAGYSGNGMTLTNNGDGTITADGTVSVAFIGVDLTPVTLDAGTYVLSGCPSGGGNNSYMLQINSPTYVEDIGDGAVFTLTSSATITVRIRITQTSTSITKMFKPMICTKAKWDISQQFEPHALQNYKLTKLQSEDRAALVEQVDEGAKNLWNFANAAVSGGGGADRVTYTKSDNSIAIMAVNSWAFVAFDVPLKKGTYYFQGLVSSITGSDSKVVTIRINGYDGTVIKRIEITANGIINGDFVVDTDRTITVSFYASEGTFTNSSYTISDLMICTEADWKISRNFALYALPNSELTKLEAEDRAALVEVVDEGAKNKLPTTDITPTGIYNNPNLTCTNNGDGTYTLNGECVVNCQIKLRTDIIASSYGNDILSGCPRDLNSSGAAAMLAIYTNNDNSGVCFDYGDGAEIPSSFVDSNLSIFVFAGHTFNNVIFKPMVCTQADWRISQKHVPYKGNFVTVPVRKNVRYNCMSTDYEHVTALDFVIPAYTYAKVTALLKYSNGAPRGIKIIDTAIANPTNAILAINEATENYGGITTSCLIYDGATKTYAVYAKSASVSENAVAITVEYLN